MAPLKRQTIPRLELLGTLLLVRFINNLDLAEKKPQDLLLDGFNDSLMLDKERKTMETCTASSGRNSQVNFKGRLSPLLQKTESSRFAIAGIKREGTVD